MGIKLENGYETKTTFWEDFTIADAFGVDAINDTFTAVPLRSEDFKIIS